MIKESLFRLRSIISPFGAVRFRPFKGVPVEVKNNFDPQAPDKGVAVIDEKGHVVVPSGGSARVIVSKGDSTVELRVEDYKERHKHTPGAKITGEGVDIDLDPKNRKELIAGIGNIKYYE